MGKKRNGVKGKKITINDILAELINRDYAIKAFYEDFFKFHGNGLEGFINVADDRMGFDKYDNFDKQGNADVLLNPIPRSQAELRRAFNLAENITKGTAWQK